MYKMCTCSSGDRAMVSGTMWRGFESLQVRFFIFEKTATANGGRNLGGLKEWLSDNLRYILVGLAIVLVGIVIVFAVKLTGGSGKKTSDSETGSQTIETGTETQAQTETEEALTENDLTVLETVQKYYTAMGNKDLDTLSGMTESLSDSDKQKIESSIIQSYNNIAVYSKKGPVDNSYVVFAYYEAKVGDVEELVPSVVCLYLKPDENGGLCVADWKSDQDTNDYIEKVIQNSDVQALIKDVNDKYQEIVSCNDELQKIVQEMDQPETEITIPDAEDSGVEANKVMKAKDVLNVRADSSEDAEIIGMLDKGDKVTRVRVLDNGWAEIKYGEATGYVLNKYLKDVK